jgi:putative FmdB family regulatory protein
VVANPLAAATFRDGEQCVPIYEYACKSCDHTLDALQKMNDDPLVDCPECGEVALKRLISAPRFRLKGQGWYETDFKKDNQRNLAKGDTEAAPSSKSDDKKESKTTKTEVKKADTKKEATSKSDSS